MDFETLLGFNSPQAFKEGAVYWEFTLCNINQPKLTRQGDMGYYAHDDTETYKTFMFDNFDKFLEVYLAAHIENIRRIDEPNGPPTLEIGAMRSGTWPPWQTGGDPCG